MRHSIFALFGAIAGAVVLMGCGTTGSDEGVEASSKENEGSKESPASTAPEFAAGQGQAAQVQKPYAAAPYGFKKGSIIPNVKLVGFANFVKDSSGAKVVELAEYYNPTGDGVYPEGSVFEAGTPKPKALAIAIGCVWCPPCNAEAADVFPVLYPKYKAQGGEILSVLIDGPTQNKPATLKSLFNWSTKYDLDYAGVIDPASRMMNLATDQAYPTNVIIDTRTMKIVQSIAGEQVPGNSFWKTYEKVLAGTL